MRTLRTVIVLVLALPIAALSQIGEPSNPMISVGIEGFWESQVERARPRIGVHQKLGWTLC